MFWIIGSPPNLEEGYSYRSIIEVKSIFGAIDTDEIIFAEGNKIYSLSQIEERLDELIKKEESTDFDFNCFLGKGSHYRYESADIECVLRNKGITDFENIVVGLENSYKTVNLLEYGEKRLNFNLNLLHYNKDEIILEARHKDEVKKVYLDFLFLESLGIKIIKSDYPESLGYDEEGNLTFYLYSEEELEEIFVKVHPIKEFTIENFKGYEEFVLPFRGKDLDLSGSIKFSISYGGQTLKEDMKVKVTGVPWYGKIRMFFRSLLK